MFGYEMTCFTANVWYNQNSKELKVKVLVMHL